MSAAARVARDETLIAMRAAGASFAAIDEALGTHPGYATHRAQTLRRRGVAVPAPGVADALPGRPRHPQADALAALVAEGLTDARIAETLAMTRNAVVALRTKLGLACNPAVARPTGRVIATAPKPTVQAPIKGTGSSTPMPPELAAAFEPAPGTRPVPFALLPPGGCKWPFDGAEATLFCAAPAVRNGHGNAGPYCACHAARAFAGRGRGA